jgi:hypothetical protein
MISSTPESFGKKMSRAVADRKTLDPADFEFCGEYYVGPNPDVADAYGCCHIPEEVHSDRLGKCEHCGTPHYYGAVFKRTDGEYLTIGNVCADKFFSYPSRKAYLVAAAKRVTAARKWKEASADKANAFLREWVVIAEALETDHPIVESIRERLFKYGSLSGKQIAFVMKLASETEDRAAEAENRRPIPAELLEGRHAFEGVALGFKDVENYYGMTTKMVFRDDRGFTLYGTAFATDDGYVKGDRVAFHATVSVSDDDPTFGFFKRPTKGRRVGENNEPSEPYKRNGTTT